MTENQNARAQGKLIMAANSIGQPIDIPTRSLNALIEADLIIFEEDKVARQTLKAAGIHRDYLRLTEHLEELTLESARNALRAGLTVVFMSDQGCPNLADPGQKLLEIAYAASAQVSPIPGPSSVTAALSVCPFLQGAFLFLGFAPREAHERELFLQEFKEFHLPLVLMDTPYRREALLNSCTTVFGENRRALLALDISGPSEIIVLNKLETLARHEHDKANFVLVIAPQPKVKGQVIGTEVNSASKAGKAAKQPLQRQRQVPPAKHQANQTSVRRKTPKK